MSRSRVRTGGLCSLGMPSLWPSRFAGYPAATVVAGANVVQMVVALARRDVLPDVHHVGQPKKVTDTSSRVKVVSAQMIPRPTRVRASTSPLVQSLRTKESSWAQWKSMSWLHSRSSAGSSGSSAAPSPGENPGPEPAQGRRASPGHLDLLRLFLTHRSGPEISEADVAGAGH